MGKFFKRLLTTIIVFVLLLGGASWWLLSYVAPEEQLDMSYEAIDVKDKALNMIKSLKPELILTEADINHLIKMHMNDDYVDSASGDAAMGLDKNIRIDGARFELEEDKLIARLNVTYKDRIHAGLDAVYSLEWQSPNIVLRPQALSLKKLKLPVSMLDTIIVPLDLPASDVVTVTDVQFLLDQIKIRFKLQIKLQL
ncbi:hypothetical protein [Paenibacillus luteus]|uniref:hypothetical protein n=1 Tax=Paenibacillus luteus TaxID=2545753 RepID=UPI0011444B33|nr:hypothetical protein [Paenibacillus luteus]